MLSLFRRNRSEKQNFICIGVTGTYGKTVVTNALASTLRANGANVCVLSSEGFAKTDTDNETEITSDNIDKDIFQTILGEINNDKTDFLILEIPLEKLITKIFSGLTMDSVILTTTENWKHFVNDFKSFENGLYRIINQISDNGLLTVNGDDKDLMGWLQEKNHAFANNIFCSWISINELKDKKFSLSGISFILHDQLLIESQMIGKNNFMNLYLAAQTCLRYMDITSISNGIQHTKNPKGSFDVYNKDPFRIIIDSARTPKQLSNSLEYIAQTKAPNASLITVLGSPYYENDQRKTNSELATQYSDIVLFAPNDPNNQHVSNINSELHQFGRSKGGATVERFYSSDETQMTDKNNFKNRLFTTVAHKAKPMVSFDYHDYSGRLDSITTAMQIARQGDVIYIPGKGNDRSILFDNVRYEWSDYEAVRIGKDKNNL